MSGGWIKDHKKELLAALAVGGGAMFLPGLLGAGAAAGAGAGASSFLPQAARATAAIREARTSDLFICILRSGGSVRELFCGALSANAQRPISGRQK